MKKMGGKGRCSTMPMPYTKEQIAMANQVNLIQYASSHGYSLENGGKKCLHVKHSGGLYLFKDSNQYYHHATESKGGMIDFLIQFEGMDFLKAVESLIGIQPTIQEYQAKNKASNNKAERGELILPKRAKTCSRIYWYLCSIRGLESNVVSQMIKEKKVYQQAERGNCVFIGYDENRIPKYCSKRGTLLDKPFKGDEEYSDKTYPFCMQGHSERLFVLESPIEVMSHASLSHLHQMDYQLDHRIALGCLSDKALIWYLEQHPEIKQIIFALNDDIDGKLPDGTPCNHGQEAAKRFCVKYEYRGYKTAIQKPLHNDFNEDLVAMKKEQELSYTANAVQEAEHGYEEEWAVGR